MSPNDSLKRFGDPSIDRLIGEVVAAGEAAIPGRIVAWYITGSHADGSAVPTSDLDIIAVVDGAVRPDEDRALRGAKNRRDRPKKPKWVG